MYDLRAVVAAGCVKLNRHRVNAQANKQGHTGAGVHGAIATFAAIHVAGHVVTHIAIHVTAHVMSHVTHLSMIHLSMAHGIGGLHGHMIRAGRGHGIDGLHEQTDDAQANHEAFHCSTSKGVCPKSDV